MVYVFSVPSLILSDLSTTDFLTLTDKFVYNKEANLSNSFSQKVKKVWKLDFLSEIVYIWATLPKTPAWLKVLLDNLKLSFHNPSHPTALYTNLDYKDLNELDTSDENEIAI